MIRTTDTYADANANGTGKAGFTEGDPGVTAPTNIRAADQNYHQEEICRTIEAHGLTLSTSQAQLSVVTEVQRAMTAIRTPTTPSGFGAATGIACWSSDSRTMPGSPPASGSNTLSPSWAAVKTNTFYVNGSSAGATTAALTAVAAKKGSSPVFVAVGSDGKMYRYAVGSFTNATVGGSPNLQKIAWDSVNSLWWAVGPGGIYKAADAATPTFSQVSATQHDSVLPLPSGRVLFFRPSDTKIYYTDDQSTLTAGATVAAFSTPVWDASNGQAVGVGTSGHLVTTTNGSSATTGSEDFLGSWGGISLFVFRGRVYIMQDDAGGNEGFHIAAYISDKFSTALADWVSMPASASSGTRYIAGCGEIVAWSDGTGMHVTNPIFDITGALA